MRNTQNGGWKWNGNLYTLTLKKYNTFLWREDGNHC